MHGTRIPLLVAMIPSLARHHAKSPLSWTRDKLLIFLLTHRKTKLMLWDTMYKLYGGKGGRGGGREREREGRGREGGRGRERERKREREREREIIDIKSSCPNVFVCVHVMCVLLQHQPLSA